MTEIHACLCGNWVNLSADDDCVMGPNMASPYIWWEKMQNSTHQFLNLKQTRCTIRIISTFTIVALTIVSIQCSFKSFLDNFF